MAALNVFSTSTPTSLSEDETPAARRRRAKSMGQMLMQQGQAPVYSPLQGFGQVALSGVGGYLEGKREAELADREAAGTKAMGAYLSRAAGTAAPTGAASSPTPASGYNSSGKMPAMTMTGSIGQYAQSIQSIESGGNYAALGPATKSGDRAHGAYQVMGANVPSWTQAALGRSMTPDEFRNDPAAQDAVFAHRFGGYVDKYGNPQDAASAWFTGRPASQGGNSRDVLGTTGNVYVDKFNRALSRTSPTRTADATTSAPEGNPGQFDGAPIPMVPNTDSSGPMVPVPPARPQFADMPAQGSAPVGMDAMGSQTGVDIGDGFTRTPDGFAIPPAPQPAAPVDMPSPTPRAALDRAAAIVGQDNGTDPSADPAMFAPQPQATMNVPVTLPGVDQAPPTTSFATPNIPTGAVPDDSSPLAVNVRGGAGTDGPVPIPIARRSALTVPLPPSRPVDLAYDPRADMPAPGAQNVALARAVMASGPDLSNSDTGGAREFTMGQSDPKALAAVLSNYAPGQGGTSGAPDRMALAQAVMASGPPSSQPNASASGFTPQQLGRAVDPSAASVPPPVTPQATPAPVSSGPQDILSPGARGGPTPGPNGPVQPAPAPAPQMAGGVDMATVTALANSPNPVHQRMAQEMVERAIQGPKYAFHMTPNGDMVRTDERGGTVAPVYNSPKPPVWGVTGKDAYGNEAYGWIDAATRTTTPQPAAPGVGGQVLPGQPGSAIPAPPPGVDPKIWREAQSKNAVADALPVDPKQTAEVRKEVLSLPSYKNVKQASPVYRAMVDTAGTDTKASDLNLIYGMGKIMDPGSVVREGEMALAQGTSGLDDRLKGFANSVFGGARLTPDTRASLLAEAHGRMKSYEDEFDADSQHYRGIAQRGRMNENDVVPTYERSKAWVAPKKGDPETPIVAPPVSAVQHLQTNPALRDAFDLKYGKGAAARALGGK